MMADGDDEMTNDDEPATLMPVSFTKCSCTNDHGGPHAAACTTRLLMLCKEMEIGVMVLELYSHLYFGGGL